MSLAYPRSREMKFWELYSAFRAEHEILKLVLYSPEWRVPYFDWLECYQELVSNQERKKLDALVPFELSREVARASQARFLFDESSRHLRAATAPPFKSRTRVMSALEVHDEFGGPCIEEVYEKGSAIIPKGL